jgi:ABC-type phosphate transport system substrate-binding protein
MLCLCIVAAAGIAALAAPGSASADLGTQCSGSNIKGLGSTFQAPAEEVWTVGFNAATDTNVFGCSGTQGSGGKPEVKYEQGKGQTGSGACLKAFGGSKEKPKYAEFGFCGTDEAPTIATEEEMEANKEGGVSREEENKKGSIETIPSAQGAVAVIVHLPEGCVAQSTVPAAAGKKAILGRLALDNTTVEQIFRGVIKNWKEVEAAQVDNSTKITCKGEGGKTPAEEEETSISVVVRQDKSGTTHIFKSWLAQINKEEWDPEEFGKISEEEGTKIGEPCGKEVVKEAGEKGITWKKVQEGCENQRWPLEAHITRPSKSGNPAVIKEVHAKPSSISYADIAVARKEGFFSKKETAGKNVNGGGENKKGTETKVGEQHTNFWAEIQNSEKPETYADPGSTGDVEKIANSNCASTHYIGEGSETFPPKTTRDTWFAVKASTVEKKYGICGLTYELALRIYKPYLQPKVLAEEEEVKKEATTVQNFLFWAINAKAQGGGSLLKNHDYEKLPPEVAKKAETGAKEIGYSTP